MYITFYMRGIQRKDEIVKKININISEKNKKIINIVLTVLQIVLVLLAVTASIIIIANPSSNTIGKTSTRLLPVLSDSMDGPHKDSFKKGDLVISKKPDGKKWDANKLEIGDIITYELPTVANAYNTHRIVDYKKNDAGQVVGYITRGDKPGLSNDEGYVLPHNVLGIYKSHLVGTGKAILWLQTPTNFLLVIVLPLVLLFVYNIVIFVKMIMDNKVAKATEQAGAGTIATEGLSEEEIKQKIIEEYLAKQKGDEAKEIKAEEIDVKVEEAPAKEEKASDDKK